MIEYASGANKTRVWWGDLPDWSYEGRDTIRLELDIQGLSSRGRTEIRCGALEMSIVRGSRVLYGGLGATFLPRETGSLMVEIVMSHEPEQSWPDSLAGRLDTINKGLPHFEYVIGVCDGVLSSENKYLLGSGTLRFAWATYGAVGSSPWIFHILSDSLAGLLAQEWNETITFEELKSVIGPANLRARRFYGN